MTARIQALYTGAVLVVSAGLALVGFAWWGPAQWLAIGVALVGAIVNIAMWRTSRRLRVLVPAGEWYVPERTVRAMVKRDDPEAKWLVVEPAPIHWRAPTEMRQPGTKPPANISLTMHLDTTEWRAGMRTVQEQIRRLTKRDGFHGG